ncbi:helix-turn-helix transcriptional regulator [Hazenella sp. IB182357]|uniref:Helix-turn-helix transcriptional regulator n=1 Tax=Polycladospora coralii TaxID=2771432 RepID=A0A926NAR5_9BACL|nr:PadR family transcriptional regulator [Polycladospora coralii]MBD1372642.1 helix-turn-helix transcriptional regulator [Polycladospora coralii]MBS7531250.1 helix-turn-helix transcriptional regulator [Polycladospora coralii]
MKHTGRHTAEFILLFLTEQDFYGGELLQKCEQKIPFNPIDSAILYRTLKKLEYEGKVQTYIDTSRQEKPVKMYQITKEGEQQLVQFEKDVEQKVSNLLFFLDQYKKWQDLKHD